MFNDEDDQVRFQVSRFGQELDEASFEPSGALFERYVRSRAMEKGSHWSYEYLLRFGDLRPEWTLHQVGLILENLEQSRSIDGGWGGDKLVRCVLHLYTLPGASTTVRESAITLFGRLLEFFPHDADQALKEWDEGRFP